MRRHLVTQLLQDKVYFPLTHAGMVLPLCVASFLAACGDDKDVKDSAYIAQSEHRLHAEQPLFQATGAPSVAGDKLKVVVTKASFTQDQLADFKASFPEANIVIVGEEDPIEEQLDEISDTDVLMTDELTPEIIQEGKRLKWIQYYAAGVDDIRYPELLERDITLTNCKIIQGPEIADHGFALLLALTRGLNKIFPNQKNEQRRWPYYRKPGNWPVELQGRTTLIIGMGGIGIQLAQRAHAFGMRVIGVDPKDLPYMLFVDAAYKPDELHQLLPQADVVFMTAPLTPQTDHMLGAGEFGLMKRGSYFIALSRGKTYDTEALVEALRAHRLAGAGLDVTDPWPLPEDHPLWSFDNVLVTPHMSGQSAQAWERRLALLKRNLARFMRGVSLINVVDKQLGY